MERLSGVCRPDDMLDRLHPQIGLFFAIISYIFFFSVIFAARKLEADNILPLNE